MIRSRCVATALCLSLGCLLSIFAGSAWAQDGTAEALPGLTPSAVVQDEGSLTDKASFFIGYNMMKNLNRQKAGEVNLEQLFEGMKSAAAGEDKKSFIAGYQMMSDFESQQFGLSLEKVFEGMKTSSSGKELGMSDEEVQTLMTSFQKLVETRQIEKIKKLSDENIAAAKAYMAKNAADNPNVKTLDNGVQYEVLTEGTGEIPTIANRVKVDYHGTFIDGSVFDSSVAPPSGQPPSPAEFQVARVVPGMSKVLQTMKVGSKWRIVIPGQVGYGAEGGAEGLVGPNQALIFELSLLEILE